MSTNMYENGKEQLIKIVSEKKPEIYDNIPQLSTELVNHEASYDDLMEYIINTGATKIMYQYYTKEQKEWDRTIENLKSFSKCCLSENSSTQQVDAWIDILAEVIRSEKDKYNATPPNNSYPNQTPNYYLPPVPVQNQPEGVQQTNSNTNITSNNTAQITFISTIPRSNTLTNSTPNNIIPGNTNTLNSKPDNLEIERSNNTSEQPQQKSPNVDTKAELEALGKKLLVLEKEESRLEKLLQNYDEETINHEDKVPSKMNMKPNSKTTDHSQAENVELNPKLIKLREAEDEFNKYNDEYQKIKDEANKYQAKLNEYEKKLKRG